MINRPGKDTNPDKQPENRFSKDKHIHDGDFKIIKWGKNISYQLLRQILTLAAYHQKNQEQTLTNRAKNLAQYLNAQDTKNWQVFIMDKLGKIDRKLTASMERHLEFQSSTHLYLIWHTLLDSQEYKYITYVTK